jgi:hypothetical protein
MPLAATCAVAIGLLAGAWPEAATSGGGSHRKDGFHGERRTHASAAVYDDGRVMMGADSRAALTAQWWRWANSIPAGVDSSTDVTGVNCAINQRGGVWFLVAPPTGNFAYTCTVPNDKAIVVGIQTYLDDYPCPPEFKFEPGPGQSLQDFLSQDITQYLDGVLATAQLDGRPVRVRRILSPLFSFTAAASQQQFDPCITGSPQLGVSDGYFAFIEPLPRGDHVMSVSVALPDGSSGAAALNLRIR